MARYDEKRRNEILKALEYADKIRSLGLECMVRDENGKPMDVQSVKVRDSIVEAYEVCAAIKKAADNSLRDALSQDGILVSVDGMIVIEPGLLGAILRKLVK